MPADLARRINETINKVLHKPEMVARFAQLGIEPGKGSATEFGAMVAADTARWKRIARAGNIKVD